MRVEMDKDRFIELLGQFRTDVPFEMTMIRTLLTQMPQQAKEGFIEELYYKYRYTGPIYIVQHCNFKTDVRFFTNLQMVKDYLIEICLEDKDYLTTLSNSVITKKMKNKEPICGYYIELGEINDDTREQFFNKYQQQ